MKTVEYEANKATSSQTNRSASVPNKPVCHDSLHFKYLCGEPSDGTVNKLVGGKTINHFRSH